jgi:hypothetical protein
MRKISVRRAQDIVSKGRKSQHIGQRWCKKPLSPMNSHSNPCSSDENETAGAPNDPDFKKTLAGFIQAPRFHQTEDPARERADIPPGGACSWTSRESGRGRRVDQWQQINPPFPHSGDRFSGAGAQCKGPSRWVADSEAKAITRLMRRAGCLSRPRFAV